MWLSKVTFSEIISQRTEENNSAESKNRDLNSPKVFVKKISYNINQAFCWRSNNPGFFFSVADLSVKCKSIASLRLFF